MAIAPTDILRAGTPVYATDPTSTTRATRHVATIVRPMRDYGQSTANYYVVRRWSGGERVYSADYIDRRHEGQDAHEWDAANA